MKKTIASLALLAAVGLLSALPARAEGGGGSGAGALRLLSFRVAQHSMIQKDGNFYTANLNWTPRYQFSPGLGVRLNLGGSYTKSTTGVASPLIDGMAYLGFVSGLTFEVGGGVQYFMSNGGMRTAAGANAVFPMHLLGIFDHAFAGYIAALIPNRMMHEAKVGLGIGF